MNSPADSIPYRFSDDDINTAPTVRVPTSSQTGDRASKCSAGRRATLESVEGIRESGDRLSLRWLQLQSAPGAVLPRHKPRISPRLPAPARRGSGGSFQLSAAAEAPAAR